MEATVIAPTLSLSASAALWDAVVIGAGPAGSITARELARAGWRTLLVDQAAFPRDKVCGGCLNLRALHTLKSLDLENVAADPGCVDQFHLGHRGRIAVAPIRLGVSVSRRVLDARLIETAVAAGAAFRPGARARLLAGTGETRVLELAASGECVTVQARIVIAADGVGGRITAADGVAARVRPGSRIGAGTILAGAIPAGSIEMAVAAGGYVGAVNVTGGNVDVAAALEPAFVREQATLGNAARAIRREAGFADLEGMAEAAWKGTPPLTRSPVRVWGHRWFAVGDAAGYVEPFTGEGMEWAIRGAAALAPIAGRAARQWSPQLGRAWQFEYQRRVARRHLLCHGITRALRSPGVCGFLVRALRAMPWLARVSMSVNGGRL